MDTAPIKEGSPKSFWNYEQFKAEVIGAVRKLEIPISKIPDNLDLSEGSIARLSDKIISETMEDPQKRERATYWKLKHDNRLFVRDNPIVGEPTRVVSTPQLDTEIYWENLTLLQEYQAIRMHSHGVKDYPPSSQDFFSVLIGNEDGGAQSFFVITPSARFCVMRTLETPDRTRSEVKEYIDAQDKAVRLKIDEEVGRGLSQKRASQKGWLFEPQIESEIERASVQVQYQHVIEICRSNNLALFVSTEDDKDVYKRQV